MTVLMRSRGPGRTFILAFCLVLSFYIYLTTNSELLFTKINQLSVEVERRIQWWDWKDTAEEVYCRAAHESVTPKKDIPNIVHFVLLANESKTVDLSYARFLAIKSAVLRMNAAEVKIHTTGMDPRSPWWLLIKDHVTTVELDREKLQSLDGLSSKDLRLPHQADLLRLHILMREGGIYMDTDVYALKPFEDLLSNPRDVIMGHEGGNRYGLCNAVIVARPRSSFMTKWQESYKTFDPNVWNEHSVRKPKKLQVQFPELICPLSPTVFFWPTWAKTHIRYMHEAITPDETASLKANMTAFGGAMYENQLAFHAAGAIDYLDALTPGDIQRRNTRFNLLLRDVATAEL